MKIAIVCFTGKSGLTDYSLSLARALAKAGSLDVVLITAESLPEHFNTFPIKIKRVFRRSRHLPIDYFRLLHNLIFGNFDVVIFQGPIKFALIDGLIARMLGLLGIRSIFTVHDVLPHYPSAISRVTFPMMYRAAEHLIVHSTRASDELTVMGVVTPRTIVPHGTYDIFDQKRFTRSSSRERLNIAQDAFICLFFGNQEERKGFVAVECAARTLMEAAGDQNIIFSFVGQPEAGGGSAAYKAAIARVKELRNCVHSFSYAPFEDVEVHFRAADVVLLPYQEGTTSGVLKLAIAFGVPVIATEVGDFVEQLGYCYHHIIRGDDVGLDLASAIRNAVHSPDSFYTKPRLDPDSLQWPLIAEKVLTGAIQHARTA